MKYNFDEIIDRNNCYSTKYVAFPKGDTVYDYPLIFSTADMDFRCSEAIRNAMQEVVDRNCYGYTKLTRHNGVEFNNAVISWYKRKYDMDLKAENIFSTEGALEAAKFAVEAFTKPGEGIIIQKPVYGPFESFVIRPAGRVVVENKLLCDENGYYTIDFADFEEKAKNPNNTAFLMCSPHNPVGRVWTEEELKKIVEICHANNVLIIADEVHCDFLRKDVEFIPVHKVAGGKGVVMCSGLGKTFNLAQLRPGVGLVTDPELLPDYAKAVGGYILTTEFKMKAMIAGYTQSDDWLEEVNEYIDGNIDACLNFFAEKMPKVKCLRPEGTYILWMDFRAYGLSDEEIHRRIYEKAWVKLEDGTMFDKTEGIGYQRICMTAPRAKILEALERIRKEFEE